MSSVVWMRASRRCAGRVAAKSGRTSPPLKPAQLPETAGLSDEELRLLLGELKQIMAVYGDACRLRPP